MRTARGRVGLLSDEILRLDAQAEKLALLFCAVQKMELKARSSFPFILFF
jgi:hypothetical protein